MTAPCLDLCIAAIKYRKSYYLKKLIQTGAWGKWRTQESRRYLTWSRRPGVKKFSPVAKSSPDNFGITCELRTIFKKFWGTHCLSPLMISLKILFINYNTWYTLHKDLWKKFLFRLSISSRKVVFFLRFFFFFLYNPLGPVYSMTVQVSPLQDACQKARKWVCGSFSIFVPVLCLVSLMLCPCVVFSFLFHIYSEVRLCYAWWI